MWDAHRGCEKISPREAIVSVSEEWTQREREAYRAWKRGNQNALVRACEPAIRKLAKNFAQASRRNRSDKLRRPSQHGGFEQDRNKEAAYTQEGLREAKEVVDPDDLFGAGCDALLDAMTRYDPGRGTPPQKFAYKRIRGAMLDLLDEKRKRENEQALPDGSEEAPRNPTEQLVALAEQGEFDDSFLIEQVALFLSRQESLDDWRAYIQSASFRSVRFFWWFLHKHADELDLKVGRVRRKRRKAMLGAATWRYYELIFKEAQESDAQFKEISGPLHMDTIEKQRKADGVRPARMDNKPMGRLLRFRSGEKPIAGDTIRRWRELRAEAGPPPLMREDGSFRLESQEDFDAFAEDLLRIADPRAWHRLQRRRQQNS